MHAPNIPQSEVVSMKKKFAKYENTSQFEDKAYIILILRTGVVIK